VKCIIKWIIIGIFNCYKNECNCTNLKLYVNCYKDINSTYLILSKNPVTYYPYKYFQQIMLYLEIYVCLLGAFTIGILYWRFVSNYKN
jgi:hypothetical protein